MDIDLKAQATIKHEYSFSSGNIKITFKDSLDTILGTVEIEEVRFRPLMNTLNSLANEIYDAYAENIQRVRTSFDKNAGEAITEFFS